MTVHKLGVILPPFPAFDEETPWRAAKLPLLLVQLLLLAEAERSV